MLGPQPPRSAEESSHAHPDAARSVAAATTEMMWAVALATTRASFASTAHGLALWSRMLRTPVGPWSLVAGSLVTGSRIAGSFAGDEAIALAASAVSGSPTAASSPSAAEMAQAAAPADAPAEEAAAFASYRSSGGHASAQVIQPDRLAERLQRADGIHRLRIRGGVRLRWLRRIGWGMRHA